PRGRCARRPASSRTERLASEVPGVELPEVVRVELQDAGIFRALGIRLGSEKGSPLVSARHRVLPRRHRIRAEQLREQTGREWFDDLDRREGMEDVPRLAVL